MAGQKNPDRSNDCHYRTDNDESPVQHPFLPSYLFTKQFQMESQRQDNTDAEAHGRT